MTSLTLLSKYMTMRNWKAWISNVWNVLEYNPLMYLEDVMSYESDIPGTPICSDVSDTSSEFEDI